MKKKKRENSLSKGSRFKLLAPILFWRRLFINVPACFTKEESAAVLFLKKIFLKPNLFSVKAKYERDYLIPSHSTSFPPSVSLPLSVGRLSPSHRFRLHFFLHTPQIFCPTAPTPHPPHREALQPLYNTPFVRQPPLLFLKKNISPLLFFTIPVVFPFFVLSVTPYLFYFLSSF